MEPMVLSAPTAAPTGFLPATPAAALRDPFGREITYLRLSVTDRCDLRCLYCMAEDMEFLPRAEVLRLEELAEIGRAFVALGVRKIRLTGGEPLVRRNLLELVASLKALPGLRELCLTTNGTRLAALAAPLRAAGIDRINISLDSLQPERYRRLTRVGELAPVLAGIEAARAVGFARIKLNAVILRHLNDDECLPLLDFALERGLDLSFIEEMPLGEIAGRDRAGAFLPSDEVRQRLARHHTLLPILETTAPGATGGPARTYRVAGSDTRVGFISPHSHNFCDTCNRVRLTVEGRLLLCLGQEHSADLRAVVRAHPGDQGRLQDAIRQAILQKPKGHEFALAAPVVLRRHMSVTGG